MERPLGIDYVSHKDYYSYRINESTYIQNLGSRFDEGIESLIKI